VQAILDGISCLTVKWTLVPLGQGRSLASHATYQAFLKATTKDKDSNPKLIVRVDVKAPDCPPKRQGPAAGHRPPRPPLAPLDSLLNARAIGSDATTQSVFRTLAGSAAKPTASGAQALPALPAPPVAAPTPPTPVPPAPARLSRAPVCASRASRPPRPPAPACLSRIRAHASCQRPRLARPPRRALQCNAAPKSLLSAAGTEIVYSLLWLCPEDNPVVLCLSVPSVSCAGWGGGVILRKLSKKVVFCMGRVCSYQSNMQDCVLL
jgi:hypothetical protein